MEKEEFGYVIHKISFSSNIYVLGNKKFTPLELSIKKDQNVELCEKVYFGDDKRDKIENVVKWISEKEFLQVSKSIALEAIEKIIIDRKEYYINFINENVLKDEFKNMLIRTLCVGPKTFIKIFDARKEKPFESIKDLEKRANTKVVVKNIASKVYDEICGKDKFKIFANKAKHLE
ncbi:MAG: hypothetical protein COT14_02555 [Candidatus Diapherotrites archaeon CG08_land_8_20_14_0_20_30_16]|nr:MAG: hypothetical protein COT14_02555 [Candidatus Diapherotrites archaeon CG08_land_8_20_14_0_20_30_16]